MIRIKINIIGIAIVAIASSFNTVTSQTMSISDIIVQQKKQQLKTKASDIEKAKNKQLTILENTIEMEKKLFRKRGVASNYNDSPVSKLLDKLINENQSLFDVTNEMLGMVMDSEESLFKADAFFLMQELSYVERYLATLVDDYSLITANISGLSGGGTGYLKVSEMRLLIEVKKLNLELREKFYEADLLLYSTDTFY